MWNVISSNGTSGHLSPQHYLLIGWYTFYLRAYILLKFHLNMFMMFAVTVKSSFVFVCISHQSTSILLALFFLKINNLQYSFHTVKQLFYYKKNQFHSAGENKMWCIIWVDIYLSDLFVERFFFLQSRYWYYWMADFLTHNCKYKLVNCLLWS